MARRRADPSDDPNSGLNNPYLNARRSWNDHVDGVAQSKRVWQTLALMTMMILLTSVVGLIYVAAQSKFVPYVVKVSDLGDAVAVSRADKASPVDRRVVAAEVAAFIQDARSVTADVTLERQNVLHVYSMLQTGDAATAKMSEWFNATPTSQPLVRAATETVEAQITSVIPASKSTWQVDWQETTRDRMGVLTSAAVRMRALVTVRVSPPTSDTTEQQVRDNPLGLYVSDYSWSRVV
jgi:type IV secretory pathway TrbF-like protein